MSFIDEKWEILFEKYHIFRLLEYEFTDIGYYNSINLVQERSYTFEDTDITLGDLHDT